ncbi:T9SS type A sorting domain-containing protein [Dyadobacter sp. CY261]|uniref:T9SS type A sorting domain-containing protein n=1 Tax=Dyadobacter sp. CY261 TaxID=2907203 RepID=UPI001F1FB998|nr:T9SS type A sorting domain-containing protein [Dyadobacter sp. CY261]MCF0074055.1 T9SS type A sorting domain-containing protein [Dyadobacter sp. CY261]
MSFGFIKHIMTGACMVLYCHLGYGQQSIPDKSVLTTPLAGARITEKAVQSITAYNNIRSGSVEYIAGKSVILESGFHVAEGAIFVARIDSVIQQVDVASVNSDITLSTDGGHDHTKLFLSAYPNPYSEDTQIEYWLPKATAVSVSVFNEKGVEVARILDNESQSKGGHKVTFASGRLPSGTYLCTVNTSTEKKTHKVIKQ